MSKSEKFHVMSDQEMLDAIYVELDRATEFGNQALTELRRHAWDYYLNRPRGDELEGRSQVQDTSVRDTTHALLASIMPAYATDHPISFEPHGPDDIDQAEAESQAVNNLFTETNQGYLELHNAVHDALLFRNGVIKVWVDERRESSHRAFQAPVADVLAQAPEDQEWEHIETDEDGLNHFRVTASTQKLRIESIEPARFYVDPNQQSANLNEHTSFIAEQTFLTRSDLIELGVPRGTVEELPATPDQGVAGSGVSNTDLLAKFIESQSSPDHQSTFGQETILCYWVHIRLDKDGDGIAESHRALVAERRLLLSDPVDFFPYASGTGWPVPHRWSGLGVYDLCRITQDERTNARRQLADNLNLANNQRPVFDPGETDAQDIVSGAPGRGIRSRNPGNVGWMPTGDIVSNSIAFLDYMDKVRSEQSGAALELASGEASMVREVSGVSVDMQLQPREQMAASVSKNLAETMVRNMFLLIHATLRTQWNQPIMFMRSGDWQQTNPREWQPRTRMNVNVGLSPGERRRQTSALQFVISTQMQMIAGGAANIATDYNGVHKALSDWMKAAELDGAEGYFLDPEGQQSQQGQQAAAQQQQAQSQQMQQMQAFQMQLEQMERQMEQAKLQLDKYEHDTELAYKYWSDLLEADTEDAKLEKQGEQMAGSPGREGTEAPARQNGADRAN